MDSYGTSGLDGGVHAMGKGCMGPGPPDPFGIIDGVSLGPSRMDARDAQRILQGSDV